MPVAFEDIRVPWVMCANCGTRAEFSPRPMVLKLKKGPGSFAKEFVWRPNVPLCAGCVESAGRAPPSPWVGLVAGGFVGWAFGPLLRAIEGVPQGITWLPTVLLAAVGFFVLAERTPTAPRTSNYYPLRLTYVLTDASLAQTPSCITLELTNAEYADEVRTANAQLVESGKLSVKIRPAGIWKNLI